LGFMFPSLLIPTVLLTLWSQTVILAKDSYNTKKGDRINRVPTKLQREMGIRILYIQWEGPDGKEVPLSVSDFVYSE
jgi:hypothetical protein